MRPAAAGILFSLTFLACNPFSTGDEPFDGGSPAEAGGGDTPDASSGADAAVQQCTSVGSAACRCGVGQTCTIDCSTQLPVNCSAGAHCTVTGSQCAVTCTGKGTTCRTDGCNQCVCTPASGGVCL